MASFYKLSLILVLCTFGLVYCGDSTPHDRDINVKLVPNRRGISSGWANRNYLNEFLYGFIEGTTKISLAGKLDCPWEIYKMGQVWLNILYDWNSWS